MQRSSVMHRLPGSNEGDAFCKITRAYLCNSHAVGSLAGTVSKKSSLSVVVVSSSPSLVVVVVSGAASVVIAAVAVTSSWPSPVANWVEKGDRRMSTDRCQSCWIDQRVYCSLTFGFGPHHFFTMGRETLLGLRRTVSQISFGTLTHLLTGTSLGTTRVTGWQTRLGTKLHVSWGTSCTNCMSGRVEDEGFNIETTWP